MFALLASTTLATRASADGGYFSGTTGARAGGRAGAFAAKADDLSAIALNPAGLAAINGTLVQIGNRFSYNALSYARAPTLDWGRLENGVPPYVTFTEVHNDTPWQLLEPLIGVASDLGLPDLGFALAVRAPAGAGRLEFPVDGAQRYMMVSRDALILEYSASAAWKPLERFGVGVSLQWIAVPQLEYRLVIDATPFAGDVNPVRSELDMLATITGADPFTLNATVGAWIRPLPYLTVALSGQVIPTSVHTESTLAIDPLSPEIDERVDLRRDGEPADDVTLELPLPITARVAVRYQHLQGARELFDVELDVTYESWSRVDQFVMDSDGLVANLLGQRLDIGRIAIEKSWRDTWSVRLGGDYSALPGLLQLRAGVFYVSAVAERAFAHVDFVSGEWLGGALGASVFVGDAEIAMAYQYQHQPELSVDEGEARVFQEVPGSRCAPPYTDDETCHPAYAGRPAPAVNAGTFRAHAHAMTIDVLYRF